jgi:hypothetical protein
LFDAIDRRKSAVSQWATLQGEKKIWNFRAADRTAQSADLPVRRLVDGAVESYF